jgi:Dockerin type I domain
MRYITILLTILMLTNLCYAQNPGDDCSNPIQITIEPYSYEPYITTDSTCGRGNAADSTCLSYYDGGEDIIYEIIVPYYTNLYFQLDTDGSGWVGMALGHDCPLEGSAYDDCIAYDVSQTGLAMEMYTSLPGGTYYLMIDTWPPPDCLSEFTLTISEYIIDVFYECDNPHPVVLPEDAPYTEQNQFTCGRMDDYSNSCLGNHDGGEDLIYLIDVRQAGTAEFILDPKGTTYTGMALGLECPPPGASVDNCMAYSSQTSPSSPHSFEVELDSGNYYLMIDTWPQPECIPDFDLTMNFAAAYVCGNANGVDDVDVSDAVWIINYVFVGGDPPNPIQSGDVNCDGTCNVSDAVWIINYVFVGGNEPCDLDGDDVPDC